MIPLTYNIKSLKPASWEFFEQMCCSAMKIEYNKRFELHGRKGQKQNGVDLYSSENNICIAVQCKHVTDLSYDDIIKEINRAKGFTGTIEVLYIATTLERDVHLQEIARKLSKNEEFEIYFEVKFLFWDDIFNILSKNKAVFDIYYQFVTYHNGDMGKEKRRKDVDLISSVLRFVDSVNSLSFIDCLPCFCRRDFVDQTIAFDHMYFNKKISFYDDELGAKFSKWVHAWDNLASYLALKFQDNGSVNIKIMEFNDDIYNDICSHIIEFKCFFVESQKELFEYLHNYYPEVDLEKLSAEARKWHAQDFL